MYTHIQPIKQALLRHFSDYEDEDKYLVRVLLPGAGLGRLTYDIAKLGFSAQVWYPNLHNS